MKQCMDSDNLHRKLKKIIGQVQAIDRMIDEDVPCEDVLSQLNTAKSALNKCGQVVLATPTAVMAAIGNATRHGFLAREGDTLEQLAEALPLYM